MYGVGAHSKASSTKRKGLPFVRLIEHQLYRLSVGILNGEVNRMGVTFLLTLLGQFLGPTGRFPVSMQITPAPHYNGRSDAMMPIEEAIIEKLRRTGPCYLDEVVMYLPNFSWGEIFIAVDRMSRDERLLLRKRGCSDYQIALGSQFAHLTSATSQKGMQSSLVA